MTHTDRFSRRLRPALKRWACVAALLIAVLGLAGCARFGRFAKANADKAAYKIVRQKQEKSFGKSSDFTIDQARDGATSKVLERAGRVDLLKISGYTTPSCVLTLADTLAIAFADNREYLSRKEALFSQALGLTNTRYNFGAIFTADASANVTRSDTGHGTPAGETVEKFGAYNAVVGLSKQVVATGARITASLSHSVTRFFNVHVDPSASNNMALQIVQPLLNGAGPLVAGEPLRQAERSMIYAVRDFKRFQQSFAIGIAGDYFRLLQSLDQLSNERHNLDSAITNRARAEMLSAAGRVPEFEADQARQSELQARDRWSLAQADYLSQLDRFKFSLGLPIDLDVGPDPSELRRIADRGLVMPGITLREALAASLRDRLDLKTAVNAAEDSDRQVRIALRNFLPTLDASYSYSATKTRDKDRLDLGTHDHTQTGGLDLGLPLDWAPRRNNYRLALIGQALAHRTRDQLRDDVILGVRDLSRQLERSRANYEIQQQSVHLAERRVESTGLLLEAGQSTTRDLLDAQAALLQAKNSLTSALVNHTIQRMQFWNAIERFEVDSKGMWYEQAAQPAPPQAQKTEKKQK